MILDILANVSGELFLFVFYSYRTDLDSFKEKVKESIESCRQEALNPDPSDPHGIK